MTVETSFLVVVCNGVSSTEWACISFDRNGVSGKLHSSVRSFVNDSVVHALDISSVYTLEVKAK